MKAMPDTAQRLEIIRRMRDIVVEDCVWIPSTHSVSFVLYHQWLKNAKHHGMTGGYLKYRDVDVDLRERLRREWNRPNYAAVAAMAAAVVLLGAVLTRIRAGRSRPEVLQ
jgi:hypothetical protein